MREHELELIAALVEGRLEDEAETRALIASSAEYQEEYEAQRLAYEALLGAPTVSLTDTERATLHRDVWSALRTEAARKPARAPWYYRWTPVAAGLFVLIGVVAIVSQGGGDATESAELAADFPVTSTAAATADDGLDTDTMAESEDSGGAESAPTTTAAQRAPQSGSDGALPLSEAEEAFYSAEAQSIRSGDLEGMVLQQYDEDSTPTDLQDCVEEADLEDYEVIATLANLPVDTTVGEDSTEPPADFTRFIVAIPDEADLSTAPVAFVDEATCELVHIDR